MMNWTSNSCGGGHLRRRAGAFAPSASPFLTSFRLDDDPDDDAEDDDEFEDDDEDGDDEEEDDEEVPETWQVERTASFARPDSRLTSDIELPRLAPSFRLVKAGIHSAGLRR
jgi:hypothetical protein